MAEPKFLNWQEISDRMITFLPPQWRANFTGKVLKRLIVAFALVMEGLYGLLAQVLRLSVVSTSEGEYLRRLVAGFGMIAYGGIRARVVVRFSRWRSVDSAVLIPPGTEVRSESGLRFLTDTAITLPAGEAAIDVSCTCASPGAAGNVLAGRIVALQTSLAGIDAVTNPDAATGGIDGESDGSIRNRVPLHLAMLHRATVPATEGAIASQLNLFPEVVAFITERNAGTPGYFRGVLADASGGDRYRVEEWRPASGLPGVYYAVLGFSAVNGLVEAGWPCKRFGVVVRDAVGAEIWAASASAAVVAQGNYRWHWSAASQRLYARADGSDLNGKDLTVLAEVTWRALRELEENWAAAGVGCDIITPFVTRIPISVSYLLEPGANSAVVETALQGAIAGYINSLGMGAPFELDNFFARIAGVVGAGSVEASSPAQTVQPGQNEIVRAESIAVVRRG